MRELLLCALLVLIPLSLARARPIPLEGTKNTRDLGGMPVHGGRLKSGMLIRSGALCYLSGPDQQRIQELGVRTFIDLRTPEEIRKEGPDRIQGLCRCHYWPMRSYHGRGAESYRSMLLANPQVLRSFFQELARPEAYPLLFHCSAGKDRTGILTALLLDFLGTPRDLILDDYLQSQRNSPRLLVEREWLQEVFEGVDRVGGTAAFLQIQGVPTPHLEAIRNCLVEPEN